MRIRIRTCILLGSTALACGNRFSADERADGGSADPRDATAGTSDGSRFSRGGAASNTGGSRNPPGGGDAQSGGSENEGGAPFGGNGGNTGGTGAAGDTGNGGAGGNAGTAMGGKAGMASGGTGSGGRGTGGKAGAGSGGTASGGMAGSSTGGASCQNGAPKCSDGTCSRLSWNFESGSLDGVVRVMSPHPPVVRDFNGNRALALDVDQLNTTGGISFMLPICNSGTVDLHSKTFTFRVYFEGTPASVGNFYVQTASPDPRTDAYLDQIGPGSGVWTTYSSPLSKSKFSSNATTITIQAGSAGAAFSGTIWFDDFAVR